MKTNKISHAYLFSGPRGTGKTTMARLLAKAVNCPNRGEAADPCQKCDICQEINDGRSVDIIEIDAASNRGIDEVRELREKIAFAPGRSKYRVYIIDEVHMLTKEAFNALLKTLEEPPEHAIFVLATTELHKVPETIVSRCQRYQFHLAPSEQLIGLIKAIAKKEKFPISDEAIGLIARRAEGSYRDALSLLGSVVGQSDDLSAETLRKLLGLPQGEVVDGLITSLQTGNAQATIAVIKDFLALGGDLSVLVKSASEELKEIVFQNESEVERAEAARLLEQLMLILNQIKTSSDPTALMTARLYSLASGNQKTTPSVEPAIQIPVSTELNQVADIQKVPTPEAAEMYTPVDAVTASPNPASVDQADFWQNLVAEVKNHNHALYAIIRSAELLEMTEDNLVVGVQFRFYVDRLHEPKNRSLVESLASKLAGQTLHLKCQVTGKAPARAEAASNLMETVVEVFEITE